MTYSSCPVFLIHCSLPLFFYISSLSALIILCFILFYFLSCTCYLYFSVIPLLPYHCTTLSSCTLILFYLYISLLSTAISYFSVQKFFFSSCWLSFNQSVPDLVPAPDQRLELSLYPSSRLPKIDFQICLSIY